MKTIDFEQAKFIATDFHSGQNSALYSFASSGVIFEDKKAEYLNEVEAELSQPHRHNKKQTLRLQLLKNYFKKYIAVVTKQHIVVTVRGGVAELYLSPSLVANDNISINIIDYDNIKAGDEMDISQKEAERLIEAGELLCTY